MPDEVVTQRLARIQALIQAQQTAFNRSCLGKTMPVLLEKRGRFEGQLVGRSPYLQPVHVSGSIGDVGTIKDVKIEAIGTNSLSGHYASVAT